MRPKQRPVMRYHGGKWRLADWVISYFPSHHAYCEPFGGAASILFHKPRSTAEVYNDLDSEVVNVFRVLRDPDRGKELIRLLTLTPYAREEYLSTFDDETVDPIERARRMIIRAFMGYSSDAATRGHRTGFRAQCEVNRYQPASQDWVGIPEGLMHWIERLQGVIIENINAPGVYPEIRRPGNAALPGSALPAGNAIRQGQAIMLPA